MASALQHLQLYLAACEPPQQEVHLTAASLQHLQLHLTAPDSPQQEVPLTASSLQHLQLHLAVPDPPQQEVHLAASTLKRVSVKCGPDGGGWRMADGKMRMIKCGWKNGEEKLPMTLCR